MKITYSDIFPLIAGSAFSNELSARFTAIKNLLNPTYRNAGAYNSGTSYSANEVVKDSDVRYVSLQDSNLNHSPSSSSLWWEIFGSGGDGGAFLPTDGGEMNGDINMNGNRVGGLPPIVTSATDAISLGQAQTLTSLLRYKAAVRQATVEALPAFTASGTTDNILTMDADGVLEIDPDGDPLEVGDSILVKNEGTAPLYVDAFNGVYTITDLGSMSSQAVIARRSDADTAAELTVGYAVSVLKGSEANRERYWVQATRGTLTLGDGGSGLQFAAGPVALGSGGSSIDSINGLDLQWVSATQVKVLAGNAYVPDASALVTVATDTTLTPTVVADTWYYVFLKGDGTFEALDVPPAFYSNKASKSAADERFVGAFLTDSSGNIFQFNGWGDGNKQYLNWNASDATFRALNGGTDETPTDVDLTSLTPATVYHLAKCVGTTALGAFNEVNVGMGTAMPGGFYAADADLYWGYVDTAGKTTYPATPPALIKMYTQNIQYYTKQWIGTNPFYIDIKGFVAWR